jgi:hypothetical protein
VDPVSRSLKTDNTQESRLSRFGDKLQKPWLKGCPSPNPGGRPKKARITRIYQRILANADNRAMIEDVIINTLTGESRMASVLMLREMAERTEGKITQSIELSGNVSNMTEEEVDEHLKKLLGLEAKTIDLSLEPQSEHVQPEPERDTGTTP